MKKDRLFGLVFLKQNVFGDYEYLCLKKKATKIFKKDEYGLTTRLSLAYIEYYDIENIPQEVKDFVEENKLKLVEIEIIYKII